jgi:hypothetical protein
MKAKICEQQQQIFIKLKALLGEWI